MSRDTAPGAHALTTTTGAAARTMSSRDIAELVGEVAA